MHIVIPRAHVERRTAGKHTVSTVVSTIIEEGPREARWKRERASPSGRGRVPPARAYHSWRVAHSLSSCFPLASIADHHSSPRTHSPYPVSSHHHYALRRRGPHAPIGYSHQPTTAFLVCSATRSHPVSSPLSHGLTPGESQVGWHRRRLTIPRSLQLLGTASSSIIQRFKEYANYSLYGSELIVGLGKAMIAQRFQSVQAK